MYLINEKLFGEVRHVYSTSAVLRVRIWTFLVKSEYFYGSGSDPYHPIKHFRLSKKKKITLTFLYVIILYHNN